jgi:hypothetical protein
VEVVEFSLDVLKRIKILFDGAWDFEVAWRLFPIEVNWAGGQFLGFSDYWSNHLISVMVSKLNLKGVFSLLIEGVEVIHDFVEFQRAVLVGSSFLFFRFR